MADLKSMLKGAVSGALNAGASNGELDLSKVSSLIESVVGYEKILTTTLGEKGTKIMDVAKNVKSTIEANMDNAAVKKALTLLKSALESVENNAICSGLAKRLEAMGV